MRRKPILVAVAITVLASLGYGWPRPEESESTCVGAQPCAACRNCHSCGHCARDGGKCGVCR